MSFHKKKIHTGNNVSYTSKQQSKIEINEPRNKKPEEGKNTKNVKFKSQVNEKVTNEKKIVRKVAQEVHRKIEEADQDQDLGIEKDQKIEDGQDHHHQDQDQNQNQDQDQDQDQEVQVDLQDQDQDQVVREHQVNL